MKKICAFFASLVFILSLAVSPVFAGGDKNHGDVGVGTVDQGETGDEKGNAQGNDAQENMAP
ncbi:MAG: hypothetical protein HKP41_23320 [Desulfobacterales bacterium]|nr:hypothetical protein [Desulfobacterales bacterium]